MEMFGNTIKVMYSGHKAPEVLTIKAMCFCMMSASRRAPFITSVTVMCYGAIIILLRQELTRLTHLSNDKI